MPDSPIYKNQKANSREYLDNYDRIFDKENRDKEMRRLRWEVKNLREKEK